MEPDVIQTNLTVGEAGATPIVIQVDLAALDAEGGGGPPPGPSGRRRPVIIACGD